MTTTTSPTIEVPELPDTELPGVKPIRGRFENKNVLDALSAFYPPNEIESMKKAGVDKRMVFGINSYYMALVKGEGLKDDMGNEILPVMAPSEPLQHLVVPIVAEAADISGEKDPSNQNRYSPGDAKGKVLHKYDEIVLGYTALACSAHCRYCYRLDLFNGSTGKGLVKPEELRDYILNYNRTLVANNGKDAESGANRWPITEVLLSGGDAMVLSNKQLYKYLAAGAEAGVDIVRIGTKEMAFRPMRFDTSFAETLRIFHKKYPHTHVNLVVHFSHPDELLQRDEQGIYKKEDGHYVLLNPVRQALENMGQLDFVTIDNQTPVIKHVNDSVESLHLLHRELRRAGVGFKYIFQCRVIEGHKAFAVPVEESWRLHNESQKGLSDGSRSRFAMSTEWGKMEVMTVTDACPDLSLTGISDEAATTAGNIFGDGLIIFKVHRSPYEATTAGDVVIARRNSNALWISDYEDRIIYDGRHAATAKYKPLIGTLLELEGQTENTRETKVA